MNTSPATTILVYRHVESVAASKGRFEGSFDTEVSDAGRAQLRDIFVPQSDFMPVTAVFTSPLRRASATAEKLGQELNVPVVAVQQLRDRNLGEFQGRVWEELNQRHGDMLTRCMEEMDVAPFGGETRRQVEARVLAAVDAIVGAHAGGRVVIVTHAEPIRAILERHDTRARLRMGAEVPHGSFVVAQAEPGNLTVSKAFAC